MQKPKPFCQTFGKWLEHYLGKRCLAPCTGQDHAALKAFAHLVELYGYSDDAGRRAAIAAMRALILDGMQPHVRVIAKRMIPHVLDWSHEREIWQAMVTLLCERCCMLPVAYTSARFCGADCSQRWEMERERDGEPKPLQAVQ